MSTTIKYNSVNPFTPLPCPLLGVAKDNFYAGERLGTISKITLAGQITGLCSGFNAIVNYQNQILSGFSKDFQTLQVYDGTGLVHSYPYCLIRSINFDDNKYSYILPYTISIDSYDSGSFAYGYGVLDPSNLWEYQQADDGVISIIHTVSARGFNTSSGNSNALSNAKSFVDSYTGMTHTVAPAFIGYSGYICPNPFQIEENINRLNGTYSVKEIYRTDKCSSDILRYSADVSYDFDDGVSTVAIKGSIDGCSNISGLRTEYLAFDSYHEASQYVQDLNPIPVSKSIVDDELSRKIDFTFTYNDDKAPQIYLDYGITISLDVITSIVSVTIRGDIRSKGEPRSNWPKVLAFFNGLDIFSLAAKEYIKHGFNDPLNPNILSKSITEDSFHAQISFSYTYSNRPIPPIGLDEFDYTINISPAIHQYSMVPIINKDNYVIFDLNYLNLASCEIHGTAKISNSTDVTAGINIIKSQIDSLSSQYFSVDSKYLEINDLSNTNESQNREVKFTAKWIGKQPEFTIS